MHVGNVHEQLHATAAARNGFIGDRRRRGDGCHGRAGARHAVERRGFVSRAAASTGGERGERERDRDLVRHYSLLQEFQDLRSQRVSRISLFCHFQR